MTPGEGPGKRKPALENVLILFGIILKIEDGGK